MKNSSRPPVRYRLLVGATIVPLLLWPWLLSALALPMAANDTLRLLLLCLPAYVLLSCYVAYRIWRERPEVSWVLLALCWISYAMLAMLSAVALRA